MTREPTVDVVITGMGPLCAAGVGRDAIWSTLRGPPPSPETFDPATEGIPSAPFAIFRPERGAVPALLSSSEQQDLPDDPELRLSVAASRLALEDAALVEADLADAALVSTYEAPGMDVLLRGLFQDFLAAAPPGRGDPAAAFTRFYERHREAVYRTHSFMHLHLLARALSIHGPTLFVNNACASGLYALEMAAAFLRDGKADLALVVAAESPAFPTKKMWFDELGIYADDGRQRPFDVDRRGLVFGEAGVALVVETREHARRRGASMRGHYLGGAFNQEAWKVAVPNLAANFYDRALAGACRNAGIAPGDVDLVNAHGAATPLSDLHEARGIVATFGDWPERPAVVAFKPYFGHTLGASALLETCCLLLCGENDCLVATPGFENPDPDLKVTPTRATAPKKLRTLLKMSNGFAGFNAAAVIRTIEEDRP